ncbi:CubicO group peptidase, beta-lactamase class C family [Parafrankia irregularis]|uniref:CubicO group peptidase, beta-lactamase class C family n=1 Tax=Parafrankia irregularis TaxID=795642 RepID=A0A0S4QXI8_9ACTN|nr:serine hydrolase [Parafrankia sp. CH37]CUU60247.1 CubicO group peptidase, beta-lactamase class C family [Parafrankia irregularis]
MRRPFRPAIGIATAACVAVLAVSCTSDGSPDGRTATAPGTPTAAATAPTKPVAVPGDTWETVEPAEVGLDPAKLDEIADTAEQGKSTCLLVSRNGKIAGEWYFRGSAPSTPSAVYSVTKSLTSTLVGIAQDDGDLRLDDSAATWIPQWKGTESEAVTIRDLVSNDSGRQWSLKIDYEDLIRAPDKTAYAVALPQEKEPGQVWAYNNSAVQTLEEVLRTATGEEVTDFARERLFEPLGMDDSRMTTDAAGNTLTFMGLQSTCRDIARLGYLMLAHGNWNGEQIVSGDWVDAATGTSSTEMNAAYGYLWWLNREGVLAQPLAASDISAAADTTKKNGSLVPGAPADMFWAIGLGNQILQIDPGSGTVVVRLGTPGARPVPPTFGTAEAARVVTEALVG